jgi:rhodanese-related sulfurtransferase
MKISILLILFSAIQVQKSIPSDFYEQMNNCENAILLDARVYAEYCESRISGAIWAGQKVVLDSLLKQLDKEATFFIYCEIGERTKEVVKILKKAKIKHIIELNGGFIAWKNDNFPISEEKICEIDL